MSARLASLLMMLSVIGLSFARCANKTESHPAQSTVAPRPADDPGSKYVGVWRDAEGTIQIRRDGAAFVIETEGPAGPKEVGTLDGGVLRIRSFSALYTPSNDHLVLNGHEYQRIDPRKQTLEDLAAIGPAVQRYIAESQYHAPPSDDFAFFAGVPKFLPAMSKVDGWGTRYRYLCKFGQSRWAVVSAGPDGVFEQVLTADMVADGMIGTGGDDIVMVNGAITSGASANADTRG